MNFKPLIPKRILLACLSCLFISGILAQEQSKTENGSSPYLMRSTLGNSGISSTITDGTATFYISQSIGQASVSGTFSNQNHTIRQGFQQPQLIVSKINLEEGLMLKATIFPNPFQQSISIQLEEPISSSLKISIFSFSGEILSDKMYPQTTLLNLPLHYLPSGQYIIRITTDRKQLISKLIKY
jgi:hypothetical protein